MQFRLNTIGFIFAFLFVFITLIIENRVECRSLVVNIKNPVRRNIHPSQVESRKKRNANVYLDDDEEADGNDALQNDERQIDQVNAEVEETFDERDAQDNDELELAAKRSAFLKSINDEERVALAQPNLRILNMADLEHKDLDDELD